jgi:23S rRNA (pseudouridine1915-N3)-methyltransferase
MKLEVWCVGECTQKYLVEGIEVYRNKLKHYFPFVYTEIKEPGSHRSQDKEKSLQFQANLILKKINPEDYLILLDEKGKKYSSRDFAQFLNKFLISGHKRIILLIGGAFGFHTSVVARAKEKISLSDMTFSHDMVRLFLLEQLYRAGTILKNEPYHND